MVRHFGKLAVIKCNTHSYSVGHFACFFFLRCCCCYCYCFQCMYVCVCDWEAVCNRCDQIDRTKWRCPLDLPHLQWFEIAAGRIIKNILRQLAIVSVRIVHEFIDACNYQEAKLIGTAHPALTTNRQTQKYIVVYSVCSIATKNTTNEISAKCENANAIIARTIIVLNDDC